MPQMDESLLLDVLRFVMCYVPFTRTTFLPEHVPGEGGGESSFRINRDGWLDCFLD